MTILLILCAMFSIEGFRLGIWIGWAIDTASNSIDAYLDGQGAFSVGDLWR